MKNSKNKPLKLITQKTLSPLNCQSEYKPHRAYTQILPQWVLPYTGYIGMCHCEGYVFTQFTPG